jgi:hypothetical protein
MGDFGFSILDFGLDGDNQIQNCGLESAATLFSKRTTVRNPKSKIQNPKFGIRCG